MIFQDYQDFAIHVTTDLATVRSCEILEDNQESQHFQTRVTGEGIQTLYTTMQYAVCTMQYTLHSIQYTLYRIIIINCKVYDLASPQSYRPPPAPEALLVHTDSAYAAAPSFGSPPERILEKPKVELRTFFPENWLFDLEFSNDTTLTR